jgi:hypothetical protein
MEFMEIHVGLKITGSFYGDSCRVGDHRKIVEWQEPSEFRLELFLTQK